MNWEDLKADYSRYLKFERALTTNSIDAYLNDVAKFQIYCEDQKLEIDKLGPRNIQKFLMYINEFGVSPYTQTRILSGLKSFFSFLIIEHNLKSNPVELIEAPRIPRKIPTVLNILEIEQMIQAIDLSTDEGMRNKAIIETLYGCGLRVSELVNLKCSNLFLDVEFIKVEGKGNKERLVPIGAQAIKY